MRKKAFVMVIFTLLLLITLFPGCLEDEGEKPVKKPAFETDTTYPPMNEVVDLANDFCFQIYQELSQNGDNLLVSPFSIMIALGMAYEGAAGLTAEEMRNVLNLPKDDEVRREMIKALLDSLNKDGTNYELSAANAYWLRKDSDTLNSEYESTLTNYYQAHGKEMEFAKDPQGTADEINEWVESETNEKIKDIVSPEITGANPYLILTNAIYFKSNWEFGFNREDTRESDFKLSSGGTVRADFMNIDAAEKKLKFNYAQNDEAQFLQLPYKDKELSMYILLPYNTPFSDIEKKLDTEYIEDLKESMSLREIDVSIPKFSYECKYNLNDNLSSMGMPTAFQPYVADFSGIKSSGGELWIDEVIHQSFIEVNEEGTEVAAATMIALSDSMGNSFRADRPFIFFIEHKETGQILFVGKLENPVA